MPDLGDEDYRVTASDLVLKGLNQVVRGVQGLCRATKVGWENRGQGRHLGSKKPSSFSDHTSPWGRGSYHQNNEKGH